MIFMKGWSHSLLLNMPEKPDVEETPSGLQYLLPGLRLNKKSDDQEKNKESLSLQNKKLEKEKVELLPSESKLYTLK